MATRTLGVKFEVVGFKEAANSIERLKRGINDSLKANRKLFNQNTRVETATLKKYQSSSQESKKNSKYKLSRNNDELKISVESNEKTSSYNNSREVLNYKLQAKIIAEAIKEVSADENDFIDNYQQAYKQIREGNVGAGILQGIKKPINSVIAGYYEAIGGEFGAIVGQKLLGKKDSSVNSFRNRNGTRGSVLIELTSQNIKDLVNAFRYNQTSNFNELQVKFTQNKEQKKDSLLSVGTKSITDRIFSVTAGYYEGIGNYFGEQFASGLSEALEDELNYSQKRKGRIFGKSVSFVAQDGMDNLKEKFNTLKFTITDLSDKTQKVDLEKINKFLTALIGIPNALVDSYLTGFRRASVSEEAIPQVDKNKAVFNEDISQIGSKKKAIITASGFAGESGKQGRKQAQRLRELNRDKNTVVLSSDTPYTDVMFKPNDAVSGAAWGLNALANSASINLKGFNPDALEMVNKVLKLREENPDIDINLVGHSAGGFVVEEAQYLLEKLGVKKTLATTIGTPNLKGGLKPKNIKRIFGKNDPLAGLHTAAELIDFVNNDYERDSVSKGHFFEQYLESPSVRKAIFNRQPYDNTGTRTSDPSSGADDPVAEVMSVIGDAVITAIETEGDTLAKANAFGEVITSASSEFYRSISQAGTEFLNNVQSQTSISSKDLTIDVSSQLNKLGKEIVRVLSEKLDRAIANYRRQVLSSVAVPKVQARSKEILQANKSKSGAGVDNDTKTIFIAVGCSSSDNGKVKR